SGCPGGLHLRVIPPPRRSSGRRHAFRCTRQHATEAVFSNETAASRLVANPRGRQGRRRLYSHQRKTERWRCRCGLEPGGERRRGGRRGSVATPDQDHLDDIGDALGVPRAPDDEIRTSAEILEERDRYRWEEEEE